MSIKTIRCLTSMNLFVKQNREMIMIAMPVCMIAVVGIQSDIQGHDIPQ